MNPLTPPEKLSKMNHMQTNSKSNTTAFFPRISQLTKTAVAVVSLTLLTSLAGLRADPTPGPTPPVPLIQQGSIQLRFSTVASGLTAPLEVSSPADGTGRLFINQQTGQILILENGSILPTPFLDVSGRMVPLMPEYDERGLLGFAFHPQFNNASAPWYHKIYTYTSEPVDGPADFTVPDPSQSSRLP
jgi:hypothetical protein